MNKLNRRKFIFFNKKIFILVSTICITIFIIFNIYSQKSFYFNSIIKIITKLSKNYEYQFTNFNVSGLNNVDRSFIKKKLKKYHNSSIFLLPLNEISNEIKNNNWIKNVKLSTNYKNTLYVDIDKYRPYAIYNFNDKLFYIDKNGKIIEQLKNNLNDNKFVIFFGKSSNLNANIILNELEESNFFNKFKVHNMIFVEKRRWDIILKSKIKLMLSEKYPSQSIKNFMDIEKNLSKTDINNIEIIDLRNIDKTIITYKND